MKKREMKKIISTLSNVGSATKTHIMLCLLAALTKHNIPFAKFDFDFEHKTLFKAYSLKDEDGDPLSEQDPITGCQLVNMNQDPQMIVRIAKELKKVNYAIADLPARALHAIFTALGARTGVEDLYNTYFENGFMACHLIPLVDSDKSLETLEEIYRKITLAELEDDAQVELVVIKNIGYMDGFGVNYTNKALAAYENSNIVASIKKDSRSILKEVEFKTQLNGDTKAVISPNKDKVNQLLDILARDDLEFDIDRLIKKMVKDGEKLLAVIQDDNQHPF